MNNELAVTGNKPQRVAGSVRLHGAIRMRANRCFASRETLVSGQRKSTSWCTTQAHFGRIRVLLGESFQRQLRLKKEKGKIYSNQLPTPPIMFVVKRSGILKNLRVRNDRYYCYYIYIVSGGPDRQPLFSTLAFTLRI